MMRPRPRRTIAGAKARIAFAVPVRLASIWMCQSGSSISSSGRNAWMPAFANRMWAPSEVRCYFCRCAAQELADPADPERNCATFRRRHRPGCLSHQGLPVRGGVTPSMVLPFTEISIPTTCAPLCANATAAARPIPRAAPVTTANLPSSMFVQPEICCFIGTSTSPHHLDAIEGNDGPAQKIPSETSPESNCICNSSPGGFLQRRTFLTSSLAASLLSERSKSFVL